VAPAIRRWFAPGFFERDPASARALLDTLRRVDDDGYARTCEALAEFDARHRLSEIDTPIVAIAGANDIATPPDSLRYIATNVTRGRFVEVAQAAHLVPAEQPDRIADVLAKLRKLGA
jgi:pimeloyl-ACP methyl ester carboxylesterase